MSRVTVPGDRYINQARLILMAHDVADISADWLGRKQCECGGRWRRWCAPWGRGCDDLRQAELFLSGEAPRPTRDMVRTAWKLLMRRGGVVKAV